MMRPRPFRRRDLAMLALLSILAYQAVVVILYVGASIDKVGATTTTRTVSASPSPAATPMLARSSTPLLALRTQLSPSLTPSASASPITYSGAVAAAAARQPPVCPGEPFQFVDYTPSALELLWQTNAASWSDDACAQLSRPSQREKIRAWLATTIQSNALPHIATAPSLLSDDPALTIFSRLRVRHNGTLVSIGIEPLAGVLRDPRPVCGARLDLKGLPPNAEIQSKDYIGLDPAHLRRVRAELASAPTRRRVLLFDLGCTRWSDTDMPGLRWLHDVYTAAGVNFTDIYGWEANPTRSQGFFDGMPIEVLSRFHFYSRAANNAPGSPDNPLEVLRLVAEPSDFVVFKLDVDTPALEKRIIIDILLDPRYSCLIDELYFEHHNSVRAMKKWWGRDGVDGSLHDSIALFQELRRAGIRAHSWP